jgi:hypothetical protein
MKSHKLRREIRAARALTPDRASYLLRALIYEGATEGLDPRYLHVLAEQCPDDDRFAVNVLRGWVVAGKDHSALAADVESAFTTEPE